jgi:uncharacterized phage-associated protein
METKIEMFEFIVHKLKDWYMDVNDIHSLDEFNKRNDFSILKLIKLHFLVSTVNSRDDDKLLNEFTFYAMPYGPVETIIYNRIKANPCFSSFTVDNFKSVFTSNDYKGSWYNESLISSIKASLNKLKDMDENLINADAGSLVELTHKWNSWRITYSEARNQGQYSKEMDRELIKRDNKYLSLQIF